MNVERLYATLLMARRHEKDFFARHGDEKYLKLHAERGQEFAALDKQIKDLLGNQDPELLQQLNAAVKGHAEYQATFGDATAAFLRRGSQDTGWGGFQVPNDVEVSPDGTIWVSDNRALNVKRFDANGKLLKTIKAGPSAPLGIGVDLDCNVWVGNISQRRIDRLSPSGRLLGTAAAPDLIAQDVVVGPKGDVYAYDGSSHAVVRFAEDRAKPATANVPGAITVSGRVARIPYTLSGVACPAQVSATATLSGPGIAGKSAGLKLKAGARNTITMKLSKAASGKATFTIVLGTNGRPTTEKRSVKVSVR